METTTIPILIVKDQDLRYDDPKFDWSQVDDGETTVDSTSSPNYNGI